MLRPSAASLLFALTLCAPALAGTLCGTVRDQSTAAPIARAGIFLRTPAGEYTGLNGATDVAGTFCIASVPAGTYDVEVRVDDYQIAYVRGVVVNATSTSVDLPVNAALDLRLTPNPARASSRIAWTMPVAGRARVTITDVTGRVLRTWESASLTAGEHSIHWNFTDRSGRSAGAGVYFIRLETSAGVRQRSLIRIL
jgi:hypothetical protein